MARRGSSITLARPAVLDESVEKNVGSGESCAAEVQLFDENGERPDEADRKRIDTDPRVLLRDTTLESIEPADVQANLRYLHLRFFGERPRAGEDPTIDALENLFFTAHDEAVANGDQVAKTPVLEGWRVVCIAMMKSPEFHIY